MKNKNFKIVILNEFNPLSKEQIQELKKNYSTGGSKFKSRTTLSNFSSK